MTEPILDAPLLARTDPALRRPLPASIAEARQTLRTVVGDILAIPESSLERPWSWIGGSEEEVRYGPYRVQELFERAEIDARRTLAARAIDAGLATDLIA